MPVITLELLPLSKEKKSELVEEMTHAAARITGLPEKSFYVFIRENEPDNIGVAGRLLSDPRRQPDENP